MEFDENAFLILAQRYKELSAASSDDPGSQDIDIPYDLVGYLTEIDTGVIDADYMNSRFDKYLKLIRQEVRPRNLLSKQRQNFTKLLLP